MIICTPPKYLNNIVEQDHRTIKRRISISTGFKEFESAQRTLAGIEIVNIIRKNQLTNPKKNWFATFLCKKVNLKDRNQQNIHGITCPPWEDMCRSHIQVLGCIRPNGEANNLKRK